VTRGFYLDHALYENSGYYSRRRSMDLHIATPADKRHGAIEVPACSFAHKLSVLDIEGDSDRAPTEIRARGFERPSLR
jgi:hypothetical protein